jgi:type VI secretion system protein ImpH
MAATGRGPAPHLRAVGRRLFAAPFEFDFFQAVRVLERMLPGKKAVGRKAAPADEVVRFRAHQSIAFPPSAITELLPPDAGSAVPLMAVPFLGLTGPSGALPTHYTQLILDQHRDVRGPERRALRDWLDLFNHRLISLFYRAWEKYRFFIPYERGEAFRGTDPDTFTRSLFSLVGLGTTGLRNRLRVAVPGTDDEGLPAERTLGRVDDLNLLFYGGMFARRVRDANSLSRLLNDYFGLAIKVREFQGQWLNLEPAVQTSLGTTGTLGMDAVAGSKVWDVQGRIRLRIGPLTYRQFEDFLPDRGPTTDRKTLFLLSHLTRLFVGPEIDFDVQLVLRALDVPACRMTNSGFGARLGWNTWLVSGTPPSDVDDAVFEGETLVHVGPHIEHG